MARHYDIKPVKTYANAANAHKAVDKLFMDMPNVRYFIAYTADGRCYPVFIGQQAMQAGVHFHFNVVG